MCLHVRLCECSHASVARASVCRVRAGSQLAGGIEGGGDVGDSGGRFDHHCRAVDGYVVTEYVIPPLHVVPGWVVG